MLNKFYATAFTSRTTQRTPKQLNLPVKPHVDDHLVTHARGMEASEDPKKEERETMDSLWSCGDRCEKIPLCGASVNKTLVASLVTELLSR